MNPCTKCSNASSLSVSSVLGVLLRRFTQHVGNVTSDVSSAVKASTISGDLNAWTGVNCAARPPAFSIIGENLTVTDSFLTLKILLTANDLGR